ncbi:MAG TPA: YaiI/YqxD family protein, partial [Pseudomonas sp.]|nr:YaiI/YqxD family protein [Pseudomonas sp.]
RNLFTDLRDQGQVGGGQAAYGERDRQTFANALDRLLTRLSRSQ